jgi:hypothetical protein
MFKSKNPEERQQEIREEFAEKWKNSQQYIDTTEAQAPFVKTSQEARIKIWIENDPFHMFMEININGWIFEKEEVDPERIMGFLQDIRVD